VGAVCKSCKRPVVWAKTVDGKMMPLDAEPDPARPERHVPVTVECGGVEHEGSPRWEGPLRIVRSVPGRGNLRTHYATCPNAKRHRRPR
jgi:hypothetical protein